jgi:ribosomal protein S18 acetylase RimI-like enzyme
MTTFTVEPAKRSDLAQIQKLIRALSAFHGDAATVTLEQLQDIFFDAQAKAKAYVAREGDVMIGYAGVLETTTIHSAIPRFDIHHLHVVENRRSKGVGRALIAAATADAAARGAKGLTIGTAPQNATAQAAYRAMGLEEITDAGPRFWIALGDA